MDSTRNARTALVPTLLNGYVLTAGGSRTGRGWSRTGRTRWRTNRRSRPGPIARASRDRIRRADPRSSPDSRTRAAVPTNGRTKAALARAIRTTRRVAGTTTTIWKSLRILPSRRRSRADAMSGAWSVTAAVTFDGLRLVVRWNEIVQGSPSSAVRRPQTGIRSASHSITT